MGSAAAEIRSRGVRGQAIKRILERGDRDSAARFTGFRNYEPQPSQFRFHVARCRYKGYSGPIGSGKSFALSYEAIRLAYKNAGRWGLIGAPTFPILRDTTQRAFIDTLEREEIRYKHDRTENIIRLPDCGSSILFRSVDHFERLRGTNLAWFGLDELTYTKQESWLRLQGRLRDPLAAEQCGFAAWTAKGYDWVHKTFIKQKSPDHVAIIAAPFENHRLKDYYESLAKTYDERFYRQEVLGEYLNIFTGRAYYAFDRETHLSAEKCQYDPNLPLVWSLDFNNTPMCSVIGQVAVHTRAAHHDWLHDTRTDEQVKREFRILDEISLLNSNIGEACAEFERKALAMTKRRPLRVIVHGDASGNNSNHAGKSDWELVLRYFRDTKDIIIEKRVPAANGHVKDRVNTVNAKLMNFKREVGIWIHPRCEALTEDLEQTGWKLDSQKNVTGVLDQAGGRTHITDALGYLIVQEEPLRSRGGFQAERVI
jgi:Terminase large subunit, T4likevirus-type, N-terminal